MILCNEHWQVNIYGQRVYCMTHCVTLEIPCRDFFSFSVFFPPLSFILWGGCKVTGWIQWTEKWIRSRCMMRKTQGRNKTDTENRSWHLPCRQKRKVLTLEKFDCCCGCVQLFAHMQNSKTQRRNLFNECHCQGAQELVFLLWISLIF